MKKTLDIDTTIYLRNIKDLFLIKLINCV